MKYNVKIFFGTFEDHELQFENITDGLPQTINWAGDSPGFVTIKEIREES